MKSPIVGTFYSSPSPNAPPFVKVGDTVQVGQVICIIEAMKLMNELEAEVAGQDCSHLRRKWPAGGVRAIPVCHRTGEEEIGVRS